MVKALQTLVHFWDIGVKSQTTMNTLLLDESGWMGRSMNTQVQKCSVSAGGDHRTARIIWAAI